LFKIGLLSCIEIIHVPLERKPPVFESGAFSTCFYVKSELVLERKNSCIKDFQGEGSLILFQIAPFS
jgi:hypothetical protein